MTNTHEVHPFEYGSIALSEVVQINDTPYITGPAIGEWLEYSEPRTSINRIIARNPHVEDFSVEVKLTSTDGKKYAVRVFHPMGFLLVVMESGQPKAIEKKIEVARFVWDHVDPARMKPGERASMERVLLQVISTLEKTSDAFSRKILLGRLHAICYQLGQPVPDTSLSGKDYRQLDLKGW